MVITYTRGAQTHLIDLIFARWHSHTLYAGVELGVCEVVGKHPMDAVETPTSQRSTATEGIDHSQTPAGSASRRTVQRTNAGGAAEAVPT